MRSHENLTKPMSMQSLIEGPTHIFHIIVLCVKICTNSYRYIQYKYMLLIYTANTIHILRRLTRLKNSSFAQPFLSFTQRPTKFFLLCFFPTNSKNDYSRNNDRKNTKEISIVIFVRKSSSKYFLFCLMSAK